MALVNVKYRVHVTEYESGWGQSYEHYDFTTREKAEAFIKRINSKLGTEKVVPDFYQVADEKIEIVEVRG